MKATHGGARPGAGRKHSKAKRSQKQLRFAVGITAE